MSARRMDILAQFLIEVVTISMMGGVIGIGLEVGASLTISVAAEWPMIIEVSSMGN
jgi:putative ABC transport system permease protein